MRTTLAQAAEVRLGRQRSPQFESGDHMVPYLRSANVQDGVLDLSDVKTMNFTPLEQSIFGLEPGDVLVTEGSGSRDTVGVSAVWQADLDGPVCFQNTLLRLRPRPGQTSGRYLAWWARHARVSGQIAAVSSGANILHIGSDGLKSLPLNLPSLEEQRRIADFLDDRVARIDQIIAARQVEAQNAAAARDAEWARITGALPGSRVPLRRFLVSIVDGPFGSSLTSNHYADSGTRVIRLGNLGIAQFRDQDSAYISDEYAASLTQHAVQPGDLLMAGLGDERWPLGRCAVAPRDLGPAIVKADCYRIRLDDRIDHDFASAYLSSPPSRGEIALAARGATRARLNTDVARTAPLAPVSQGAQIAYARDVARLQENEARMRRGLDAQVALLQEYKQCLITAAVTGEFDVTTASTRIPG